MSKSKTFTARLRNWDQDVKEGQLVYYVKEEQLYIVKEFNQDGSLEVKESSRDVYNMTDKQFNAIPEIYLV